ncbi:hypothetical protein BpHYR1_026554 [Brachionus plicatilis]|uniref:Uncharacterized protein n=1 Tax=Brachionus plicatilis TaxID=10195 RepID=A0A3M7SC85_BRAPC|nr:hypothetical protein BpHYR1_026554 [Brachionus plicatilis]
MFEFERLAAVVALELAQLGIHVMAEHVPLQTVQVVEQLFAYLAHEQVGLDLRFIVHGLVGRWRRIQRVELHILIYSRSNNKVK